MAFGYNNTTEVTILSDHFSGRTFEMGLYNDATDSLTDSDSAGAITTEPNGSAYNRPTVDGSNDVTVSSVNGNAEADVAAQLFDVSDDSANVDAFFLYDSSDDSFFRGEIDTSSLGTDYVDLSQNTSVKLGGVITEFEG
jgi:hypothetical protein